MTGEEVLQKIASLQELREECIKLEEEYKDKDKHLRGILVGVRITAIKTALDMYQKAINKVKVDI